MRAVPALDLHGAASLDEWGLVAAALDDFPVVAIHETGTDAEPAWRVFFRGEAARDRAATTLIASFPALTITPVLVEDEDWARRSQAALRAIQVGRLIIAPPWDVPGALNAPGAPNAPAPTASLAPNSPARTAPSAPNSAASTIIIVPSTGFGTGHHETTRLCLLLLQEQEVGGRAVLDVGTGSGVLAIAAALLGAARVTAIDTDPDALENAHENARLNGLAVDHDRAGAPALTIARGDIRELDAAADVVLANLTGALLTASAAHLAGQVRPGGVLIASGFLQHEADGVIDAFERTLLLTVTARRHEGDWNAVTLLRR
jgi:ribosomal protein L11 methyltransferase